MYVYVGVVWVCWGPGLYLGGGVVSCTCMWVMCVCGWVLAGRGTTVSYQSLYYKFANCQNHVVRSPVCTFA